jgi:zinc protease
LQDKADIGNFTAALLLRGTTLHTRQQIQDELTRLKATLSVRGGANGVAINFETASASLNPLLALVSEILKQPLFPASDFDEMKRDSVARIESATTDPNAIAGLALRRTLSPYLRNDFRYTPSFEEHIAAIKAVSIGDVQAFYQKFYGANNAEAAFVGNVDPDPVGKQLTELLGTWKSATSYERAAAIFKPSAGDSKTFATPDKPNAIYLVGESLKIRDDDPDYAALQVGNEILGGGLLNSRLASRIRQKDGLSYSVGSQFNADSQDTVGSFTLFAISAPQNTAKVEIDAKEEIVRALSDGFTPAEITAAKSGILQSLAANRASDAALARDLAEHLFLNRDFTWDGNFENSISAATPDRTHKAMQRFIVPADWVTVKAGDFAKASKVGD